jgi:hypothetical protein
MRTEQKGVRLQPPDPLGMYTRLFAPVLPAQ